MPVIYEIKLLVSDKNSFHIYNRAIISVIHLFRERGACLMQDRSAQAIVKQSLTIAVH